jgi:NAD(P) transhydrogenase subunit alpha
VALTPDVSGKLVEAGHEVVLEAGAGLEAGYPDHDYRQRGAEVGDAEAAWSAEFVATVLRPDPPERVEGATALLGLLAPFDEPPAMKALAATGVTAFAFEAVPRITRAQPVDALSSQATAAGYQAALEAAALCDRFFPMLTTAAGTVAPAKVLVLGAGVAGLQAIATARRLGAVVSAYDVRAAAAEQVRSLGAGFVELDVPAQDETATGGYARELEEEHQRKVLAELTPHVTGADAVIATAAIPGKRAPLLVTAAMVEAMRPGSVVVDLAAATGGNCELTAPGSTIRHGHVTIVGDLDLPSRVANHASQMYARNVAAFLRLVAPQGELVVDSDDEVVAQSTITRGGDVVHPMVRQALEGS